MDYNRICAANDRLMGHKRVTPLLSSPFLDEIAGKRIFVKPECLQHTGSFKYRGAFSAVSALPDETRAKGVIAFSWAIMRRAWPWPRVNMGSVR